MESAKTNNIVVRWDPPVMTTFSVLKYVLSIEGLGNTFEYTHSVELPGEKEKYNFSNLPGKVHAIVLFLEAGFKYWSRHLWPRKEKHSTKCCIAYSGLYQCNGTFFIY